MALFFFVRIGDVLTALLLLLLLLSHDRVDRQRSRPADPIVWRDSPVIIRCYHQCMANENGQHTCLQLDVVKQPNSRGTGVSCSYVVGVFVRGGKRRFSLWQALTGLPADPLHLLTKPASRKPGSGDMILTWRLQPVTWQIKH